MKECPNRHMLLPNDVEKTRERYKVIIISLTININPISVGYMKNKIRLVNEQSILVLEKIIFHS